MDVSNLPIVGAGEQEIIKAAIALAPAGHCAMFGVGMGKIKLLSRHGLTWGFDCFTGLPEDWRHCPAGTFAQSVPEEQGNWTFIKGMFQDALPSFMPIVPFGLVYVDCDLYSSTLCVLKELPRMCAPEAIVIFDEFYNFDGCEQYEQKALEDSGLKYEFLFRTEPCAEKVAIRLL